MSLRLSCSGRPPFSASMLAPKVGLQRREAVELVQHHVGHGVALQLDDDAHAVAVGLVAQMSEMPSILFSRTSSAIFSTIVALFT